MRPVVLRVNLLQVSIMPLIYVCVTCAHAGIHIRTHVHACIYICIKSTHTYIFIRALIVIHTDIHRENLN